MKRTGRMATESLRFGVEGVGAVHGRWVDGPDGVFVFAHGAGAGMDHAFMEGVAARLGRSGIATLRWDFPYIRAGRPLPPAVRTLLPVARAAVDVARERAAGRPLWAGGKSMGGRVVSMAEAEEPLGADGLIFVGFPLHPRGRPSTERARHLCETAPPLRFVSGTRDRLADPALLDGVVADLGARAELHAVAGADHGFHVLVRSGRTDAQVLDEVAETIVGWIS